MRSIMFFLHSLHGVRWHGVSPSRWWNIATTRSPRRTGSISTSVGELGEAVSGLNCSVRLKELEAVGDFNLGGDAANEGFSPAMIAAAC